VLKMRAFVGIGARLSASLLIVIPPTAFSIMR
jgi:hypothetical protein